MANNITIETLIENSLKELSKIGEENDIPPIGKSRLIFPRKINEKRRFCEQEARFLFTQELENQEKFYYSVEPPTKLKYKGFAAGNPEISTSKDGRSGSIDVCLYNSDYKRIALVEFKFGMPSLEYIEKDFLKLLVDEPEIEQNYFIHVVEKLDTEPIKVTTIKYNKCLEKLKKTTEGREKSEVKIFLFSIEKGDMNVYKISKNLSLDIISEVSK